MTTTIGGTTVADPTYGYEGVEVDEVDSSIILELADGTAVAQHVNTRQRFRVRWVGLTAAQVTTLEGTLTRATSLAVLLPHMGSTVNCFVVPNTYKKSYINKADGTTYLFKCEVTFIEVS